MGLVGWQLTHTHTHLSLANVTAPGPEQVLKQLVWSKQTYNKTTGNDRPPGDSSRDLFIP